MRKTFFSILSLLLVHAQVQVFAIDNNYLQEKLEVIKNYVQNRTYVLRDLRSIDRIAKIMTFDAMQPMLYANQYFEGCFCSRSAFIKESVYYLINNSSNEYEGEALKTLIPEYSGCLRLRARQNRNNPLVDQYAVGMMYINSSLKRYLGFYKTINIASLETCDGVYERNNFSLEKNGETFEFRTMYNTAQLTLIRDYRGHYVVNLKLPSSEISAVYDDNGLHINDVKFPYSWSSSNEVKKLDENIVKNINKAPIYLSEFYNKIFYKNFLFKNENSPSREKVIYPFEYLYLIILYPYSPQTLYFLESGYELVEKKVPVEEMEKKDKEKGFVLTYE